MYKYPISLFQGILGPRGPSGSPGPPVSTHSYCKFKLCIVLIEPLLIPTSSMCHVVYMKINFLLSFNRELRDTPDTLVSPESPDRL